jgi:patatin-like phospholipase/acyl hydrolase
MVAALKVFFLLLCWLILKRLNIDITDYFDLITGTSTGESLPLVWAWG